MSVTWNTGFEGAPIGTNAGSVLDDKIRELKGGVRERFEKEHYMNLSSGLVAEDGYHLAGSAFPFYDSGTARTTRTDTTSLTAADNGRLLLDSATGKLYKWLNGTGWTVVNCELSVYTGTAYEDSKVTISINDPSGGDNNDIWIKVAT